MSMWWIFCSKYLNNLSIYVFSLFFSSSPCSSLGREQGHRKNRVQGGLGEGFEASGVWIYYLFHRIYQFTSSLLFFSSCVYKYLLKNQFSILFFSYFNSFLWFSKENIKRNINSKIPKYKKWCKMIKNTVFVSILSWSIISKLFSEIYDIKNSAMRMEKCKTFFIELSFPKPPKRIFLVRYTTSLKDFERSHEYFLFCHVYVVTSTLSLVNLLLNVSKLCSLI